VPVKSPGTGAGAAALGLGGGGGGGGAGVVVVAGGAGGAAVVVGLGGVTGWTLVGALGAGGASGAGGAGEVAALPPQLPTGGVSGSLPILWALLPRCASGMARTVPLTAVEQPSLMLPMLARNMSGRAAIEAAMVARSSRMLISPSRKARR